MGPLFDSALNWLTGKILEGLTALWNLLLQTALTLPDVTALPQVTEMTNTSLMIVNACFVLAIIAGGILVMTKETLQVRYGIAEVGPRLVIGFIAANMATFISGQLITLANAFTQALGGEGITSTGSFGLLRDTVKDALTGDQPAAIVASILVTIVAILTALLLVQWLVRLGVLIVLVGIAPIALACHALAQIEAAAKLWWRAMLGTVGTVVLQALALHTALSIFLNPKANLASLGLPQDPSHTFNLFVVVCLLVAVLKIPGLMRRYVTKSGGGGIGTFVIVQQLTRALTKVITRVPAPSSGGGAAGAGGARMVGGRSPRPAPIGGGGRRVPPPRPGGRIPGSNPVGRNAATGRGTTAVGPARGPGAASTLGGPAPAATSARLTRPVQPYTPEQLRAGVDSYTPVARRHAGSAPPRATPPARRTP
jgi:hypothetical protein